MNSHERTLEWAKLLALTDPKRAAKVDEMEIQTYIKQKIAPFDDYSLGTREKDEEAVAKWIGENLK